MELRLILPRRDQEGDHGVRLRGRVAEVSTRMLLVLSLLCALAILGAFSLQVLVAR